MANEDPIGGKLTRRSFWIVATYGFLLYFVALGSNRVLTLHEALFAQAAKEMVASHDWILTTYGGAYFNHKPPLTYWILASLFTVFKTESEWLIRAPFALASIATGLIVARLAARRHGDWVGLLAGLIQLSTYYMLMQGRLAESDILLCYFVTLATAAFAYSRVLPSMSDLGDSQGGRRFHHYCFHAAAGLAFMTKGPIGLVFVFGPALAWNVLERDWKAWKYYLSPGPLVVLTILVLGWPYMAWRSDPNIFETWRYHNLGRFMGEMGGRKPPLFYAYTVPYLLLPWTPCLLVGLWIGWKRGLMRDPVWRLLGLTFLCGYGVLSAAVWQYKHYLIPVLPPLSVFAGYGLAWMLKAVYADISKVNATIAELADGTVLPMPSARTAARFLFGSVAVIALATTVLAMPRFDSYRDQTDFARKVNSMTPIHEHLYLVELPENQITYYLRMPLQRVDDPKAFVANVAPTFDGAAIHIVGPENLERRLAVAGRVEKLESCPTIRTIMKPEERITLFRLTPNRLANSATTTSR